MSRFRKTPTINFVNISNTRPTSAEKGWKRSGGTRRKDPAAKAAKPDDFMDMRFVAELEKEGFFKKFAVK